MKKNTQQLITRARELADTPMDMLEYVSEDMAELLEEMADELDRIHRLVQEQCKQLCASSLPYGRHAPACLNEELFGGNQEEKSGGLSDS